MDNKNENIFDENSMRKNKICCYCNISMTNIGTHTHTAKAQWKNFFFRETETNPEYYAIQ